MFEQMPSWLLQEYFGIEVWRILIATLIVFTGFLSRAVIKALFRGVLLARAEKSDAKWDDELIDKVPGPLAAIAQLVIWYFAIMILQLPDEPVAINKYVGEGLKVGVSLAIVWLLLRIIDVFSNAFLRAASKTDSRLDDQLIPLVRKTLKTVVVALAVVQIVQNLGYSVTGILAGLGVGGLALALAAQDTVENMFGSLVVFTDRPFSVGDWVEVGGVEGTVEEVGFRTTRIRRFDKALVVVPNSLFSSSAITNFSNRPIRRIKILVGLTYDTNSSQMQKFLESARAMIQGHPAIDQGFNFVHFVNFNESSLDVEFYCFTKSIVWTDWLKAQEDINLKIMDIVESQGLEIAFRTQTIYLKNDASAVKPAA